MEERLTQGVHKVTINGRHSGTVNGVSDVPSFDVNEILLQTEMGMLTICGEELHITRLSLEKGEVDIEGMVNSMTYSDKAAPGKRAESIFGRMFR